MTHKAKLLIIEDEEPIRIGLEDLFVYHGFDVTTAADGPSGLAKALSGTFELILLDIMLPIMDGFAVCERIRLIDRTQPIIMLTARTADADIIQGLRLGADDYVSKPFSVTELVLRVQAVLRRSGGWSEPAPVLRIGDLELNARELNGRRGQVDIPFTRREVAVLSYLAEQRERSVSREELLNKVWGYARDCGLETRTVDIHIAKIRRKIETDPASPRFLVTVRGVGYRLNLGSREG